MRLGRELTIPDLEALKKPCVVTTVRREGRDTAITMWLESINEDVVVFSPRASASSSSLPSTRII